MGASVVALHPGASMSPASPAVQPGSIVRGPTLPEPGEILAIVPMGDSLNVIGRGMHTGLTHDPVLSPQQLSQPVVSSPREPFDDDARLLRLGVDAHPLMGHLPVVAPTSHLTLTPSGDGTPSCLGTHSLLFPTASSSPADTRCTHISGCERM